jgi:hypothetical protein
MDHKERDAAEDPGTGTAMSRRVLFRRTLMAAGAAGALFGLTACPGGDEGDDDEDDDDD